MIERFRQLPASIRDLARSVSIAGASGAAGDSIPALVIHPDWITPAPAVLWLHGRTAYKELDPGRYARWAKAGIATIAIDLPGHGERAGELGKLPAYELIRLALPELDRVVENFADPVWQGVIDLDRLAIGGMSLGGMIALRRLCEAHTFVCSSVEGTTGDIRALYERSEAGGSAVADGARDMIATTNPAEHLAAFEPVPLLALHSEADEIVPWTSQLAFLERLRARYRDCGADPELIQWRTWARTGAPQEHIGFGKVSNEAKNVQSEFIARRLRRP